MTKVYPSQRRFRVVLDRIFYMTKVITFEEESYWSRKRELNAVKVETIVKHEENGLRIRIYQRNVV